MKIILLLLKLLFLGGLFLISNYELYLSDSHDREVFANFYISWIENLVNQGVDVTGYVIRFEWLPRIDENFVEGG